MIKTPTKLWHCCIEELYYIRVSEIFVRYIKNHVVLLLERTLEYVHFLM
jgi:hypothetical protein